MAVVMLISACYGVWQLAMLSSWTRTVRVSALFLAVAVGLYGAGTLTVFLQLLYTHAVAAGTGKPLDEVIRTASYTVDPLIEEVIKVVPLLLLVLLHKRIRRQWGLTDYALVGAALGSGFTLAEALLRFSGKASNADGGLFQGWDISAGFSVIHVPGVPAMLTSWLPSPVTYGSLFGGGDDVAYNPHLLLSVLAGLGVGLLVRGGKLLWIAGLGLFAYAWADHATHNYRVAEPEETGFVGLLSGPMEILNKAEWLYPILALGVAFYLDRRVLKASRLAMPDVQTSGSLLSFAGRKLPWSALVAGRFVLLRRNLYYAGASDTVELREMVRGIRTHIDAMDSAETWQTVKLPKLQGGRVRAYLPMVVSLILMIPALLYFVVGTFPLTSGVQGLLTTSVMTPVMLGFAVAGLLWLAWQTLQTARSLPKQRTLPLADPLARGDLRLMNGLGAIVVGATSLYIALTGRGLNGPLFSTESDHILDALGNATTWCGITLMLMGLLMLIFPPGGFALAGIGVAAGAITPSAVFGTGLALGLGGVLMSTAGKDPIDWHEKYADEADQWADEPKQQRISDANKRELQESPWLKEKVPDVKVRREFMKWLEKGHDQGLPHDHLNPYPGSQAAEEALAEFLASR